MCLKMVGSQNTIVALGKNKKRRFPSLLLCQWVGGLLTLSSPSKHYKYIDYNAKFQTFKQLFTITP